MARDYDTNTLEGGWVLEGTNGSGALVRIVLGETELADADLGIAIGRHPDVVERVIDDPTVSKRHCRFSLQNGQLAIEDLNSLNATLLDGAEVPCFRPVSVAEGQVVTLGAVALVVRALSDEATSR